MRKWTAQEFRDSHLPHRLAVLRGFRNRSGSDGDAHRAMKDGAMITCRVLWSLLGVKIDSRDETAPASPKVAPSFVPFDQQGKAKLPPGVTISPFTSESFDNLGTQREDIVLVLVAANKCVAHIDEYPDHGVTEDILDRVIDTTLAEIDARISSAASDVHANRH
jgi:hypothetical protein